MTDDDNWFDDLTPVVTVLNREEFDKLWDIINNPKPPTEALKKLMRDYHHVNKHGITIFTKDDLDDYEYSG
jgi:hypothetical protein